MDELYKDINRWIIEQRKIKQEEEVNQLADILVEGFMWQLEGKSEESVKEGPKEKIKAEFQQFHY